MKKKHQQSTALYPTKWLFIFPKIWAGGIIAA